MGNNYVLYVVRENVIIASYYLGKSMIGRELTRRNGFLLVGDVYLATKEKILKLIKRAHEEDFAYVETPTYEDLRDLPEEKCLWQVLME